MNNLINKFLLADNKFMTEPHLRWPGFTSSACGPFTRNKEKIQKFKSCFQHDIAYGDFKDLPRRTTFDEVLRDKATNIVKNPEYEYFEKISATHTCKSVVNTFGGAIKSEIMSTQQ